MTVIRKTLNEKKFTKWNGKDTDHLWAWSSAVVDEHVQALRSREFNGAVMPERPLLVHHHRNDEPCYLAAEVGIDNPTGCDMPAQLRPHELVRVVD